MNIIIVGAGKLGSAFAEQLVSEGHSIVIVDKEGTVLRKSLEKKDISTVQGNGASSDVLIEAGAQRADVLIACTVSDELNMLSCLIARKLGTKHTIARVRDPEYYKQVDLLKDDLGLSMAVNPDLASAEELSRMIVIPSANKVELFAKGKVELVEYKLPEGCLLDGLCLSEFYIRTKIKLLVCSVCRDGNVYIPNGSFCTRAGDIIYISAQHSEILKFFRILGKSNAKLDTAMIVGGGRIGYYLAQKLLKMGMSVKIIEKKKEVCETLAERLPKVTVVRGDGADRDLLLEEGYNRADAFFALTGDDEDNMVMSVYAKEDGCKKIITKLSHNLSFGASFGLDCVVIPQKVVANNVTSYVRAMQKSGDSNVETVYSLIDGKAEALEFILRDESASYYNVPLSALRSKFKKNLLIACISRNREIIIPGGNDSFRYGDSVVVVTAESGFYDFLDIFE